MPPWNRRQFKLRPSFVWKFRLKAAQHRWLHSMSKCGEAEVRPFLVTGPARSGTSLLTALLTRKPNVLVVNEPVVVSDLTFVEYDPARLLKGYVGYTAHRAITTGRLKTKVDPDSPDKPTTDTANRGYARNDVPVEVDASKPLAIGIKHPQTFMEFLDEIWDGWPELKVICAIRDPGPTIRSWRETGFGWDPQIDDPSQGIWRRYYEQIPADVTDPLVKRAHVWRIQVERACAWAKERPEQFLISRYENVVANPALAMAKLFHHVEAADPDDPMDVSDVQPQGRAEYRGFTDEEAQMIESICGESNSRAKST